MEDLDVFYHIFHQDIQLLMSQFLPTEKYKAFLKSHYPNLSTYYFLRLSNKAEGTLQIVSHSQFPFYQNHNIKVKEGFRNVEVQELDVYLLQILCYSLGIKINEIQEMHLMEKEEEIEVSLFINKNFSNLSDKDLCYYYYYKLMQDASSNITKRLYQLYFDEHITEEIRIQKFRKYQLKLNYYISTLEKQYPENSIKSDAPEKTVQDAIDCIRKCLNDIIVYMEDSFHDYLDPAIDISNKKREQFVREYKIKCNELIFLFQSQQLPLDIENEVCKPLRRITDHKLRCFTYKEHTYYRKYISLFIRLFEKSQEPKHDEIYSLLIALNFNTHKIGMAMCDELVTRLNELTDESEKQVYLYEQLAKVNSVPVTSEIKYYSEFPRLKDYLTDFIKERIELSCQTVKINQFEYRKISVSDIDVVDIPDTRINKRRINLTVPELSLIARLFTEAKVINIKDNKQQYFKFLSQIYMSKDDKNLSENSIKNAFYSSSNETLDSIERLLIRMLNIIQKFKNSKMIK